MFIRYASRGIRSGMEAGAESLLQDFSGFLQRPLPQTHTHKVEWKQKWKQSCKKSFLCNDYVCSTSPGRDTHSLH